MKITKRIICLSLVVLTLAVLCLTFASCDNGKDKGELLATYKGGEVYESDLEDWQNYFLVVNASSIMEADDAQAAILEELDSVTSFYVKMKTFRQYLSDEGVVTLTDDDLKAAEKLYKAQIESDYSSRGGYEYWLVTFNVSEDFISSYSEIQLLTTYLEKYVMDEYGVTDEMIQDYWNKNAYKYLVEPSYIFDTIFVPVAEEDRGDADAFAAAKAEAQGYIDRILGGEAFADVKADALKNSKDANTSEVYSIEDSVAKTACSDYEDLEARLKEAKDYVDSVKEEKGTEFVEFANPNGNQKQYELWFNYCNKENQAYVKNFLVTSEIGDVTAEPIRHLLGYEVLMLTKISEDVEFQNPTDNKEIYDEIYQIIYDSLWNEGEGASVQALELQLADNYDIEIKFSYLDDYNETTGK